LKNGVKGRWARLMPRLLLLWLMILSGCLSMRLDKTGELMRNHPKGFKDAVNASAESEKFVRDALKVIIDLEAKLENQ
jgi:hypothetical protein|tara:strand:+ start:441 stop:674 length:234 start_codon:yes stop_codon:yes gene_type:complete